MALPVNIEKLISGKTVEWERLEFKKGWNPESIVHSIAAFANDINDWDGGYIIIGIEEKDGKAILPPHGLKPEQLDAIQKKLIELCNHHIQPNYRPIVEPEVFQDKHILILWCPAGDMRPYKAPKNLGKEKKVKLPYIRSGSKSIEAKGETLRQLTELTARIPFDDRMNQEATKEDLDLGLIREYLKSINSKLFDESHDMPFNELCKQMHIVKGGNEALRPVNVGLMFFNQHPERFFKNAHIELSIHKDNSGRNFTEKVFKGPLNKQITSVLDYLQTTIIAEEVAKKSDAAKAQRFYNFPYEALEEVVSNAVYHKGYDYPAPIEIQVLPDAIEVLSFPGPVPPIDNTTLTQRRISARNYRNRRIGEFLKELELTEGKATGFPRIRDAMESNGSPEPIFKTDEGRTLFQVVLNVHPLFQRKTTPLTSDKIVLSSQYWDINTLEDVNEVIKYLQVKINALNKHISGKSDQAGDQVLSSDNKENNKISDQVGDQVGNQVLIPDIEVDNSLKTDISNQVSNQVGMHALDILEFCKVPRSRKEVLENLLKISAQTKNYNNHIKPLFELEWLGRTEKETSSSKQKYLTSFKGRLVLTLLNKYDDKT